MSNVVAFPTRRPAGPPSFGPIHVRFSRSDLERTAGQARAVDNALQILALSADELSAHCIASRGAGGTTPEVVLVRLEDSLERMQDTIDIVRGARDRLLMILRDLDGGAA